MSKPWSSPTPLWMNPPFNLLGSSQRAANSTVRRICCRRWCLPADMPLYRERGATLLPPPRWLTVTYYVNRPEPPRPEITPDSEPSPPQPPLPFSSTCPVDTPFVWFQELPPEVKPDSVVPQLVPYGGR